MQKSKRKSKAEPIRPPETEAKPRTERERRLHEQVLYGICFAEPLKHMELEYRELTMWPLMGLVELLQGDYCEELGSSWLANFITDVLTDVAGEGLAAVTNDPEAVRRRFNDCIEGFEAQLSDARGMADTYADYLPLKPAASVAATA